MTIESQNTEKSPEELFDEIMQAKAAGTDYGRIVEKSDVKDTPTVEETVPEKLPEPIVTTTEEEVTPKEGETVTPPQTKETPAAPVNDDWEAGLPDEVKEKIKQLKDEKAQLDHRVKSELGRLPYLQRKIDELTRQQSAPQPKTLPVDPAAPKTSSATSKFDEKLAEARAVDPALADLLQAMRDEIVNPLREEVLNEVNQTKAMFVNQEQEQLWKSEKAKLLQQIPQADDVFKHPLYQQWKKEIPENLRTLATSIYADEVVIALEQFAKYAAAVQPELIASPAPAATITTTTPAVDTLASKVATDRERKLTAGNPATTAVTPKVVESELDGEALFKQITDKIRKGESYKV